MTPSARRVRASVPVNAAPGQIRRLPALATIAVIGVVAVAVLGFGITRFGLLSSFDRSVSRSLNELHTGVLGGLATGIYSVLSPVFAVVITAVIAAVILAATRRIRIAITFAVIVAVTWLPSAAMKILVHRARPDITTLAHPFAHQPVDGSYPSGHLVYVAAVVVTFALLARPGAWRGFALVAGTILCILVGVALVVDGVHYPTDVFASALWSATIAPLVFALCARVLLQRGTLRST